MLKIKKIGQSAREIASDTLGMLVRRKGDNEQPFAKGMMLPSDTVDNYEELTADQIPAYTEAEYEDLVGRKIAERYSINAQIALLRQAATKPDEFAAFDAFAEACKAEARKELAERGKDE